MNVVFEYKPNEREVKALEELLPLWQQYKDKDDTYPFKHWNIEDLLKAIIKTGIEAHISKNIKLDQWQFGLIEYSEIISKEMFRIKEEREKGGSQGD